MQIIEDEGLLGKLEGKVFLITGANSGIGVETARAIHATGADVYMTSRNTENGQKVASEIIAENSGSKGKIDVLNLQLDSLQSVRACAADFMSKSKRLNVLINNAGNATSGNLNKSAYECFAQRPFSQSVSAISSAS